MKSIAVLLTVFNRKLKTLKCLEQLYKLNLPAGYVIHTYVVDDNSTDGTGQAIMQFFPQVKLLNGDGTLYWNRGMYTAWVAASDEDPDYYLWLNDDTFLFIDALSATLDLSEIKSNNSIIVGPTCSELDNTKTTYGGRHGKIILPVKKEIQECQTFNGNFVLIPKNVFKRLGYLDYYFRHSFGDIEYGLRANKLGIKSYLLNKHIGNCEPHENVIKCFSPNFNFRTRLNHFYSPLGMNPLEFFHMNIKYKGLFKSISIFASTHVRVLLPKLWL